MKRLLVLLMATLVLVACGNKEDEINENINESLAEDSKAVLEVVRDIVEKGRELTESEERTFERYNEKYDPSSTLKEIDLSGEDIALFVATKELISSAKSAENNTHLPSDKGDGSLFQYRIEQFESVLKTGEMILVGEGTEEVNPELQGFIESYNNQVDSLLEAEDIPSIGEIDENDLGELKKEDKLYWQVLLDHEDYNIKAKYDNKKKLTGYNIYSVGDKDLNEQGIVSAIAVAKSLELDVQEYHKNFTAALKSEEPNNEYKESDYEISFLIDHDLNLLVVNFDKQG